MGAAGDDGLYFVGEIKKSSEPRDSAGAEFYVVGGD